MPTGAIIGGIVGGGISAGASLMGSSMQADAAGNALALQRQMYGDSTKRYDEALTRQAGYTSQGQDTLRPFVDTGKGAMYSLAQLYGINTPGGAGGEAFNNNALEAFRKAPDYDWRMKEGTRALDFSSSARGTLGSRGHLNATVAFGQGLASQGLGDYTSRLLALAGVGSNAATNSASLLTSAGNAGLTGATSMANSTTQQGQVLGNTTMAQGQANASGVIGAANAVNGSIGNTTNGLMLYNAISGNSAYGNNNPAYGMGNGEWGGSSRNPLPGLDASDYGAGY